MYFNNFEFIAVIFLALAAVLTSGCTKSSTGSNTASENVRNSATAPKRDDLDLELARLALKAMLQISDDPSLRLIQPDLLTEPTDMHTTEAVIFAFGSNCQVNLSDHSWNIFGPNEPSTRWVYKGKFQKSATGQWEAIQTSKGEMYFRNGGG